jgi:hypothetical protein
MLDIQPQWCIRRPLQRPRLDLDQALDIRQRMDQAMDYLA